MISFKSRKLVVLEANLDDMNPEWYQPLMEDLFSAGALDVTLIPTVMKKSRPAILLQVLSEPQKEAKFVQIILEGSTSLGVRSYPVTRYETLRSIQVVKTPYGDVSVKVAKDKTGHVVNVAPEYASCLEIARKKKVPLKAVYQEALRNCRVDL